MALGELPQSSFRDSAGNVDSDAASMSSSFSSTSSIADEESLDSKTKFAEQMPRFTPTGQTFLSTMKLSKRTTKTSVQVPLDTSAIDEETIFPASTTNRHSPFNRIKKPSTLTGKTSDASVWESLSNRTFGPIVILSDKDGLSPSVSQRTTANLTQDAAILTPFPTITTTTPPIVTPAILTLTPTTNFSLMFPSTHPGEKFYGLGAVVFICVTLGCAMSFAGMCKLKRRNPLTGNLGDSAVFSEDRYIPRHRRFTVTQIVYRSADFLRQLDRHVEYRRRGLSSTASTTAAAEGVPEVGRRGIRATESFVHVPDILNPIPSNSGSPTVDRNRGKCSGVDVINGEAIGRRVGIGSSAKVKTRKLGKSIDRMKSKLRIAAGCEWHKFHQKVTSKLTKFRKSGTYVGADDADYQPLSQLIVSECHSNENPQNNSLKTSKRQLHSPAASKWRGKSDVSKISKSFGSRQYLRLVQSEDELEEELEKEDFLQSSTSDDDYFALV